MLYVCLTRSDLCEGKNQCLPYTKCECRESDLDGEGGGRGDQDGEHM